MKQSCDRCHKRGEGRQVDVKGTPSDEHGLDWPRSTFLMRIGELCAACRRDLIRTIRAWSRNGTKYNRPGFVKGK